MGKTILFIMLLFCTTSMFSEEFDERDLIGKWETIDSIGSFRSNPASISCPVENIDYIDLYDFRRNQDDSCGVVICTVYEKVEHYHNDGSVSESWEYVKRYGHINLWFISNVNKLHIQCWARADVKYVIKSLDSEFLILETYDGKGKLTLRRVKDKDSSYVNQSIIVEPDERSKYTLDGLKIEASAPKGIYISSGKKRIEE